MTPDPVICARLVQRAYALMGAAPGFPIDLSDLGHQWEATIFGVDPNLFTSERVPFGFVSTGPGGTFVTFRGTDDASEWVMDAEFLLEVCPLVPGGHWEHGFGQTFSSLTVGGNPLSAALPGLKPDVITGHSLGCPLAGYAALLSHSLPRLVLIASPKPGDAALAAAVRAACASIVSYANPCDLVPKLPFALDWPFRLEDVVSVAPLTELDRASVVPSIPGDLYSSHIMASYLRLLEALPVAA